MLELPRHKIHPLPAPPRQRMLPAIDLRQKDRDMDAQQPAESASDEDFARALEAALGTDIGSPLLSPAPDPKPPVDIRATYWKDGKYNLQDMSHLHEAVLTFIIANPGATLRQIGDYFGYSAQWVSILTNSDLFQARLRERQEQVFSAVTAEIPEKIRAVADLGLEKMAAHLEKTEDPRFILEATKASLAALGFGGKAAQPAVNVNAQNVQQVFVASRADLEAARGRITGGAVQSGELVSAPDAAQLPSPAPVLAAPNEGGAEPPEVLGAV